MERHDRLVHEPIDETPERTPGTVRRTSHIQMDYLDDGGLVMTGAARDLRTDDDGAARALATAEVRAEAAADRKLLALDITPARRAAEALLGLPVASGFRAAVIQALPDEHEAATPLALLLDDLPVAALISGYAMLYSGGGPTLDAGASFKSDICAGWRADGTMMISIRAGEGVPVSYGPPAPTIERLDDADSWHEVPVLPPGSMRRRRLVEIETGESPAFWAMFRDSHAGDDGEETVLHEYTVSGSLVGSTTTVSTCVATPRVLPWPECPNAAASAGRLVGLDVGDIRDHVHSDLRGTSTCTHLNDLLRSLGDLGALRKT